MPRSRPKRSRARRSRKSAMSLKQDANMQPGFGACKMPRMSQFFRRRSSSTSGQGAERPRVNKCAGRGAEAGNIPCRAYGARMRLSAHYRRISAAKQCILNCDTNINSIVQACLCIKRLNRDKFRTRATILEHFLNAIRVSSPSPHTVVCKFSA